MVQSALTFTTKIKDYNIMVHTLHIGGNHKCFTLNIIQFIHKHLSIAKIIWRKILCIPVKSEIIFAKISTLIVFQGLNFSYTKVV
jgi:hypothetical protein